MSSVIVTCPKCKKQQPVDAAIPPEGLRYACAYCQTAFRVKLPPGAAAAARPPAPPPVPDFAAMGLGGGDPTTARPGYERDLPAARPSSELRLARGGGSSADLPAAREDMPMPGDLPAPREDIPMPGDLPAPRDAMPMPDDFLAPRESVPRPDDLLAPRDSIPLPDDFPAARESVPRPDDLLAPRDSIPLPDDFLAPRDEVPRPDDLLEPIQGPAGQANLPVSRLGQNLPTAVKGPAGQTNLPVSLTGANLPVSRLGQVPIATKAKARPSMPTLDLDPFGTEMPSAQGSPLEELELGGSGGSTTQRATLTPMKGADPSFGLELEGGTVPVEETTGSPRRPLNISVPSATKGPSPSEERLPVLKPHATTKRAASADTMAAAGSRKRPLIIVGAVAGVVAIAGGAFVFLHARGAEPKPEEVLGPIAAEIANDQYAAYQRGADRLMEVAGQHPEAIGVRAAAAEDLLLAFLAHGGGERSKLAQAEQIVSALPAKDKPNAYATRARAELALAKGKPSDVQGILGLEASTPEGDLVVGLRELAAVKR